MSLAALAQQHNRRPTDTRVTHVLSCENIISLRQLARHFFKAPGLDGITNDMLKGAPQQVARHLHPLLCKMSLGCEEPMSLKGSLATDLCKGRGVQIGHDLLQEHCLQQCAFQNTTTSSCDPVCCLWWNTSSETPSAEASPTKEVDRASLLARSLLARLSDLKRTSLVIFQCLN